jgi:sterol desaturase/sphingolipid hydroxylase (fatty acid hydroxylase superfamily)
MLGNLHVFAYICLSLIYKMIDYRQTHHQLDISHYRQVAPKVFTNLFVSFVCCEIVDNIGFCHGHGGIVEIGLCFSISMITTDIWFYTFHRLFHQIPSLYRIHKLHHTYIEPFAFAAIYSHTIEHVVANIGSIAIGVLVSNLIGICSIEFVYMWVLLATWSTCSAHARVNSDTSPHSQHHELFNFNYGQGVYICDKIMGSYIPAKKTYDAVNRRIEDGGTE